jgi:hypothetical protein
MGPVLRLAPSVHTPPNASRRQVRIITAGGLALVVVVTLALFLDLGRPAFWDPGESRYAETVREMLLTGNWIGPTLNFARYYDKPPGYFWLLAGAFTGIRARRVGGPPALGRRGRAHDRARGGIRLAARRCARGPRRRPHPRDCCAVRGTRPLGQDGHAADPARPPRGVRHVATTPGSCRDGTFAARVR